MAFLALSKVEINFAEREFNWKTYTLEKALPTTKRVQMIDRKEFTAAALALEEKVFVVHVAYLGAKMAMHPARKAQVASLFAKEISVFEEYANFSDVFFKESAAMLPNGWDINEHAIDLEPGKQLRYGTVYSLGLVELETLKTYIETNLANGFIRLSKSPAGVPILFDRKPDVGLRLCVDYRGLNSLTIKNQYPLPLIGELLDLLRKAKRFIQLNLTSAYHHMRIKQGNKWKTAFKPRYGHYEYHVMRFSLSNAPTSFQGYINKILAEKLDIFLIVYLDDIPIYMENSGQAHVDALW